MLSKKQLVNYAENILENIEKSDFDNKIALKCKDLIKSDIPKSINISDKGEKLIPLLSHNKYFNDYVKQVRKLELSNQSELEYILDNYILNRKRNSDYFGIDAFSISIYEKIDKYEKALKIAEELIDIKSDSIVIRSFLRICRLSENLQKIDKILSLHQDILKKDDFNVLYELVYYYEAKNNLDEVQKTLERIHKNAPESIPIQRALKNFYIRFGLLDDANQVEHNIQKLSKTRKKGNRFPNEYKESYASPWSTIKELSSKLEHQKQLSAISDLTRGISHELGQPITNIRFTIQFYQRLIKKNDESQIIFEAFNSILEETERMGGIINRLSPITSSKNIIETFDVVDRIDKRINNEIIKIKELKIAIKITPKKPVFITSDPVKFDQIINNLLLNAIDAIKDNKKSIKHRIDIQVKDSEEEVNLIFSDTGVGIPVKYRGKIFDPFFSTKEAGKGEGLGLFIIWNILKIESGKIVLDPRYRIGARFLITMPKVSPIFKERRKNNE